MGFFAPGCAGSRSEERKASRRLRIDVSAESRGMLGVLPEVHGCDFKDPNESQIFTGLGTSLVYTCHDL